MVLLLNNIQTNSMYTFTLFLHSWNRWLILIAGIIVIGSAIKGLIANSEFTRFQKRWSTVFISSLHLQLLVGIIMYFFLSPVTALAMKDSMLRFWAVEHTLVNIIAIGIAQTGSILAKKAGTQQSKHRRTLLWTGIAFILILAMIPMGMMGVSRPLFRF